MQLTPRQLIVQFAHVLQQDLFPVIQAALGPFSPQMQLLMSVVSLLPLERLLYPLRCAIGRPAKDRQALATAFIAKAILNLSTTRDLIDRLRVDEALRKLCGWSSPAAVPHESKFSRAFAEFAASNYPNSYMKQSLLLPSSNGWSVTSRATPPPFRLANDSIPKANPPSPRRPNARRALC